MDRKRRFVDKYIRKLPGTGRTVALCLKEYKHREAKVQVLGAQAQMRMFDFLYGLRLGILLLKHNDNLSVLLQT